MINLPYHQLFQLTENMMKTRDGAVPMSARPVMPTQKHCSGI